MLHEVGVDAEGFTPALRALATVASVVEPYEAASPELLGRRAGLSVSPRRCRRWCATQGRARPRS